MATAADVLRYARQLQEVSPSFLAEVISVETGEDYRNRDLLDQVARLIEIFGIDALLTLSDALYGPSVMG